MKKNHWYTNFIPLKKHRKILLIMKQFVIIMLVFNLNAFSNVVGQNINEFKVNDKNLKECIQKIEKITGIGFLYKVEEVNKIKGISVSMKNTTVSLILDKILKNTNFTYEINNGVVLIIKKLNTNSQTQNRITIKGNVKDRDGNNLPGVTIRIKGTAIGTTTDLDGNFKISLSFDKHKILIFSFIGMVTKEFTIVDEKPINIIMEVAMQEIEEVVCTGVFMRKANSYTGSITTVKGEELKKVGNTNILQSLKNIDPAFQVIENNDYGSDPNRIPDIQMRGSSSFSDMKDKYQTNPNQPLFIVDGFEQMIEKVMDMDMNRVATITILKDATAKALYGSKGANGVVVIETIAPAKGKMRVTYIGNINIQIPDLNSYRLCDAKQKLQIEKDAGIYTDIYGNPWTQQELDTKYNSYYKEILRGVNTYWLDKPIQVGVGHKHSVSLEGGDDVIRYGIDLQYNDVVGVMKKSGRKVFSGGFTFQYRYKDLLFKDQLTITSNKSTNSPYGSFSDYAKLNPYWRAYNDDGTVKEILGNYELANFQGEKPIYNPLVNANVGTKDNSKYTDITNNFYLEWSAFEGMKFKGRFGMTSRKSESELFYPRDHTMFKDISVDSEDYFKRGSYDKSNGTSSNYSTDISANYSKEIKKHVLFANAQWSFSENKSETLAFGAVGFANDKMDYMTHAKEYKTGAPTGSESLSREMSFLASINYSYDTRFLLDATFRTNASSLFGSNKRWGNFWSTGIGWNMHKENFMKDMTYVNKLKLRISTGYSGSQNFNSYQSISTYKYYNEIYDNIIGAYMLGLANDDLKWQKTQDNNFGVDLSLFRKIDISFDYYIKNTENLLSPVSLAPSAGFESYTENLGETENKGFEAKVNYRIISSLKKQLYFSVYASIMHNKNKIKKISDSLYSSNATKDEEKDNASGGNPNLENNSGTTKPSIRYKEGESLDAIWVVRSLGLDPNTGKEVFLNKNGEMVYRWNAKDQIAIGNKLPKYSGTFGFNFDYRGLNVSSSFFYRLGGDYYNETLLNKVENVDIQYNVDKRMLTDRWSEKGIPAKFRKFDPYAALTRPTSRFVQKMNELQMTSLNIAYDFRNCNFIKKSQLQNLKISFMMNDVFRLSSIKAERGIEYPFARSCSFSVQATF